MTKSKGLVLASLILILGAVGCSSDDNPVLEDKIQVVEDQMNTALPAITGLLQQLNPYNPPPPPTPQLGVDASCPSTKELEELCLTSGTAVCTENGPDFDYLFTDCTTEVVELGVTITLVVNGTFTYNDPPGAGGWPSGSKAVQFDGGALLGSFNYDVTLDGTKDAIVIAVSGTGFTALCCVDLDTEMAECFEPDAGEEVCDPVKKPA
jgi:hypothetical protein